MSLSPLMGSRAEGLMREAEAATGERIGGPDTGVRRYGSPDYNQAELKGLTDNPVVQSGNAAATAAAPHRLRTGSQYPTIRTNVVESADARARQEQRHRRQRGCCS
jgi:hypothetical protein